MKNKSRKYDYGEWEICDAKLVERRIKQDFWIRGKLWWGSGLSIDLSVSKHGGQSFIFANIVDLLMPTINMMPRIETTLLDDYCGAGGIAFSLTDGLNRQRAPQQHWHARH